MGEMHVETTTYIKENNPFTACHLDSSIAQTKTQTINLGAK